MKFRDITVDETTGAVNLRAVFPNPEETLLPGMFVRAVVQEGVNKHAILIPQQAVTRDTKGNPLCLIDRSGGKGSAAGQLFWIGPSGTGGWCPRALPSGDRIVVEGAQKVRPGAVVKAVPFVNGAARQGRTRKGGSVIRRIQVTEGHHAFEILFGPSGLCLGDRHHSDGGRGHGHLFPSRVSVSAHCAAVHRRYRRPIRGLPPKRWKTA